MADPSVVLRLVVDQNSPDNNLRKSSELEFNHLAAQNPSQLAFHLIQSALAENLSVDVRQSCLLHLKRLVPKFWSIGFELFIGPAIDQELKRVIRQNLVQLVTSTTISKIRSGAAYVIVQIAASDYPDEWPDLLGQLYSHTTDLSNEPAVVGGLAVLTDLFDDLITEDQFWGGGVGAQLISNVTHVLGQDALSPDIKTSALKLYLTVFNTLLSAEAMEVKERRSSVTQHIVQFSELTLTLLQKLMTASTSTEAVALNELHYRAYLYKVLSRVLSSFSKLVSENAKVAFIQTLCHDLVFGSRAFRAASSSLDVFIKIPDDLSDPQKCVTNYLANLLQCLSLLQHRIPLSQTLSKEEFTQFLLCLVECATLSEDMVDDFTADANAFVTEITGLSAQASVRDSISEFLMDVNDQDATQLFHVINERWINVELPWALKEAHLFLTEALLLNEDAENLGTNLPLSKYLESLNALVSVEQGPSNHPLLISRVFLVLPKFFEKFSNKLSVNTFGAIEFKNTFAYAAHPQNFDLFDLIQASALVSATFWKNLPGLKLPDLGTDLQANIFEVAYAMFSDSEEDTLPVLLEAISVAIDIDHHWAFKAVVAQQFSVIDLIFQISFKDPANVQLTIDSTECIEVLLANVLNEEYIQVCQKLIPFILDIINNSLSQQLVEYSPQLYLALEILGYIVGASPGEDSRDNFPSEVFTFIFPVLKNLILRTNDDQILQNSGEVFNNLLKRASKLFVEYVDEETKQSGMELLLEVANKFLSPELSDSAAMSCGLIVISLFENFQEYLDNNFYFQLLQATVRRLVIAKEVVTIENLIMVFCKLVLNYSPEHLINALVEVREGDKNGLQLVLPIWFSSFEVTRGFEKIKQNILALGRIFSFNDDRVKSIIVDGDLIPYEGDMIITRSMSKKMPERYTQIPAPLKILKLLAGELEFQCQQPDANDYLPERVEDEENDGDWEDLDDIGVPNYEKLKSYIDSDEEEEDNADSGIKEILVQFFKECTSKDLGGFQQYYEAMSDDEKKVITENLVF